MLSRLKEYIDFKGIPVARFEKSIGMSNASFGKSLKNKGNIGADKLESILNVYPDLNLYWLVCGKGKMLIGEQDALISADVTKLTPEKDIAEKEKVILAQKETIDIQRKYIRRLEDEIESLKSKVEESKPAEAGQKKERPGSPVKAKQVRDRCRSGCRP